MSLWTLLTITVMFLTSMQVWRSEGEAYFYPAYDDDEAIYDDLYNEIKEALANLNPSGDYVSADLFYGAKCFLSYKYCDSSGGKMEKAWQFVAA